HDQNEKENQQTSSAAILAASGLANGFSSSLVLAANCFEDEIDPSSKAAFKVSCAEGRRNSIANNLVAGDVGKGPFQPVARLDPHAVIVDKNKENSAIVPPLLPHLPGLKSALGKVFNRTLRRHGPPDGDDDLIGGLAFKLRELFIETLRCSGRNHASV